MKIRPGRFTADYADPVVVFVIGMRINHFLKFGKWMPVARAMGPMIAELQETIYVNMPEWGLSKIAGFVPATGSRNEARLRMSAPAQ